MTRREQIIQEREEFYGMELGVDFDAGVNGLCDGESCRHPECSCFSAFEIAVDAELQREKQVVSQ